MALVAPKLWIPQRVLVTPAAAEYEHGRAIVERCEHLGVPVERLAANRLTGLRGADERDTYRRSKSTLAVVVSPPGERRLKPIPPSADWQFHLARGCPAHCQYCYLAGSLPGPPITRAYANLDEILAAVDEHVGRGGVTSRQPARAQEGTTFEASCYTDPLALEHLTGSLAAAIEAFGRRDDDASLRFTTKFDAVDDLLDLDHRGRTRVRFSVNAAGVAGFEGGTAPVRARVAALARMAGAGYPVGLTIAPIMPVEGWREQYAALLDDVVAALAIHDDVDLTVELITHRFTETSKEVLSGWYPGSRLEMDESVRTLKRTKFGGGKYVYPRATMGELRGFLEAAIAERLPEARVLYWT
ncbi:MAG: Spore photoproduct lyase [uncultured Solirubrobacteraceae bacterium]|uniref:Spore photoproduct lyase n=1 Tax=uncultured Solirubrobacteraceae bacterium TaxID=1162706 RepID=A0A6J4RXX5_9ACTN|nr:MAG: Spore photoproduct lyase [uncultured Solirubrobacteraceae bacterium]